MATLSAAKLAVARRATSGQLKKIVEYSGADKPTLNAAVQAVEDWFEGQRSTISTDINTATSPTVLSANTKKFLVASYLAYKAAKELE